MPSSPRLRLLIAGLAWPPETFLERLVRGLLNAGLQVTLACADRPGPEWFAYPGFGWLSTPGWRGNFFARILPLMGQAMWGIGHGQDDLRTLAAHTRQLSAFREWLAFWHSVLPYAGRRWDVIYFPWNSAAIRYLSLFDLGMPVVLSCRGSQVNIAPYDPRRTAIRAGLRATFDRAAAVHCVSEDIQRAAMQWGLSPEKSHVIYPAVDPLFFRPREAAQPLDEPFRVITTGALIWCKGYEYALQAIRFLLDQGVPVELTIVGDGPERQRLLYTIHDLHLASVVRLLGRLTPEAVREQLQQADVFLLSSLSEGLSNAALEAMACGLPVVTTDAGGMREAVTDGQEGFLIPIRDATAIASAISKLQQVELRKQFGQAARRRVCEQFSLEKQIGEFVQLFETTG